MVLNFYFLIMKQDKKLLKFFNLNILKLKSSHYVEATTGYYL